MTTNEREEPFPENGYHISSSQEKKEFVLDVEAGLCLDPMVADVKLYDYFNGLLSDSDRDRVKQHIVICSACQITLAKLNVLYLVLKEKADTFFPRDNK